ncbi:MAG: hypothetical protein KGI37_04110 [Alphaproteobacteria bacterium]|nr:hypothetical protein [Alphaproteobacteria bacterium]
MRRVVGHQVSTMKGGFITALEFNTVTLSLCDEVFNSLVAKGFRRHANIPGFVVQNLAGGWLVLNRDANITVSREGVADNAVRRKKFKKNGSLFKELPRRAGGMGNKSLALGQLAHF